MAPSGVNNSARENMAAIRRLHLDWSGARATTGSDGVYWFNTSRAVSAYFDGLTLELDFNHATTGASTLNINTLGAKALKKANDQDTVSGDIEAGQKNIVTYYGTNFQILSQLATSITISLPGSSTNRTVVLWSGTGGNTLKDGPALATSGFPLVSQGSGADPIFVAVGATGIAARAVSTAALARGDTGTIIAYDANRDAATVATAASGFVLTTQTDLPPAFLERSFAPDFKSSGQTVTVDTVLAVAHGLGDFPVLFMVVLKNTTAELGYDVGDEINWTGVAAAHVSSDRGATVAASVTGITIVQGEAFPIINRTTLNMSIITVGNWAWVIRAWK